MSNFNLGNIQGSACGLDAFFQSEPALVRPLQAQTSPLRHTAAAQATAQPPAQRGFKRVASLADLNGFVRVAEDQLVHKSQRDLWSLKKSDAGEFYIERMFEDGAPLKG